MTDTSATPPNQPGPSPRELIESALATAIDRVGPVLFFDPGRLRTLLLHATTDAPREVEMLLAALGEEVPQHLLAAHGDDEIHALLPQLVQRVAKNRKVERGPATWAVRAWAHALALPTTGLEPVSRAAPDRADRGATTRPATEPPTRRPPVPVPTPTPTPKATPVVIPPSRPVIAPIVPPDVVPVAAVTPPVGAPAERAFDPADAFSDFVPLDASGRGDEPETIVGPAPELVPGAAGGDATATMAAVLDARPSRDPVHERLGAMRPPAAPEPGLFRPRNLAVAALIAFVVVAAAVGYALWPSLMPTTTTTSTSNAVNEVAMTRAAPASVPDKAPTPDASPASPAASDSPAAGPSVTPTAETTRTPGTLPAPVTSPIETPPAESPAPATAASAPVVETAASEPAPTITRIDVPTAAIGKPFSIALAVDGDPRRVASIERRLIESDTTWPSGSLTSSTRTLARTKSGGFMVPFRPIDRASTSTIQFVAIDRAGMRGPARRVTLKIASDAPMAAATASVVETADSACTPSTCGSVVSLREIELRSGATSYETIVRLDDRSIQNVAQPTRWMLGTRVKMVGGRFIPIDN